MIQWHLLLEHLSQTRAENETLSEDVPSTNKPGTEKSVAQPPTKVEQVKSLHTKLGNQAVAKLMQHAAEFDAQIDPDEKQYLSEQQDGELNEAEQAFVAQIPDKKESEKQQAQDESQSTEEPESGPDFQNSGLAPDQNKPAEQPENKQNKEYEAALRNVLSKPLLPKLKDWQRLEMHYLSAGPKAQLQTLETLMKVFTSLDDKQRKTLFQRIDALGLQRLHLIQALFNRLLADVSQQEEAEPEPAPEPEEDD